MNATLELRVQRDGGRLRLLSPDVGLFTAAHDAGSVLIPGGPAGVLLVLGRAIHLLVPEGVQGRVVDAARERVQAPVGYGDVLYELEPITAKDAGLTAGSATKSDASGLVLRSPQSGRFYQRSAPGEAAFAAADQALKDGQPIGLIEVMKTFTHVVYRASSTLPPTARFVRYAAADGSEVRAGDVLIELARL